MSRLLSTLLWLACCLLRALRQQALQAQGSTTPLFKLHFLLSCHYCIGNIHDFDQQAVRTPVEITQHA